MADKKLPKVNVEFGRSGDKPDAKKLRGMVCNPIYAGVGPYPQLIEDETWVRSAARMIAEEGSEQFLVNMLFVLREALKESD
ncbi:MAG: hypothetical protein H6673_09770 [Anaerolineales bacterium]|nr:hypothetical protein [Anaerolineales bacterium]